MNDNRDEALSMRAINSNTPKRIGWEDAFKVMSENGDNELVMPDLFADEKIDDWT